MRKQKGAVEASATRLADRTGSQLTQKSLEVSVVLDCVHLWEAIVRDLSLASSHFGPGGSWLCVELET